MGTLRYGVICSVDGYVADAEGRFDWAQPTEELHAYVNDRERDVATYVYGRRMYETMRYWETGGDDSPGVAREYAGIWREAEKIVCSDSLDDVTTSRTRLEPRLTLDRARELRDTVPGIVSIGGATLAAEPLRAGLVDEVHLYLTPHVVGGGTRALPEGARLHWWLAGHHRFGDGTIHLLYRPA